MDEIPYKKYFKTLVSGINYFFERRLFQSTRNNSVVKSLAELAGVDFWQRPVIANVVKQSHFFNKPLIENYIISSGTPSHAFLIKQNTSQK